ncbi:MAG: thioredoxin [Candidatus Dormibacteraeota bacterium]|uniref:Thioredoxin n=1 Tax=Candidatus Dormiibacter inghamiae TaxID=3127013 RepID=A0A934KDB3_9BACT|nr:thioredoxin [Candidatus Dormibacteraeota bacterium]MBJ7605752.1 thioredoxin [Candidatus Dormibacteraeota bacterium]
MTVKTVTDADFEAQVLKAAEPVLVDFWAEWCGPCRAIGPIVDELSRDLADKVKVLKMDVDENRQTPSSLGIMSIPTLIMFKDGRAAERTVGYRPDLKRDLRQKLEALL